MFYIVFPVKVSSRPASFFRACEILEAEKNVVDDSVLYNGEGYRCYWLGVVDVARLMSRENALMCVGGTRIPTARRKPDRKTTAPEVCI